MYVHKGNIEVTDGKCLKIFDVIVLKQMKLIYAIVRFINPYVVSLQELVDIYV